MNLRDLIESVERLRALLREAEQLEAGRYELEIRRRVAQLLVDMWVSIEIPFPVVEFKGPVNFAEESIQMLASATAQQLRSTAVTLYKCNEGSCTGGLEVSIHDDRLHLKCQKCHKEWDVGPATKI